MILPFLSFGLLSEERNRRRVDGASISQFLSTVFGRGQSGIGGKRRDNFYNPFVKGGDILGELKEMKENARPFS